MAIAMTMREYLENNYIPYETVAHGETGSSAMTARAAGIARADLAKGVLLRCEGDYVLAVLPAASHVDLERIRKIVGTRAELASEEDTAMLFPDCDAGAVPVFGMLYRVGTVIDESLENHDDIYFEGGDHRTLVHVAGDEFSRLMYGVPHGRFAV